MDHSPRSEAPDRGPGYETRDLALKPIVYFVVGLLLFGGAVQYVMRTIMTVYYFPQSASANVPKFDDVMRDQNQPYAPQLQRDTTKDMLEMYAQEDAILESYGVDKKTGAQRIPLARAIDVVARKGLPVRPNPPERPKELAYPARSEPYKATP
ncbi:hypothetical protein TA3x_000732 [Tundrisphaera sp. TA3]|uniref:hypothetical protein n=1 Tax=Tundrisphaera sp. TA3 TaxID=3435775 RepID=UPI003EB9EA68